MLRRASFLLLGAGAIACGGGNDADLEEDSRCRSSRCASADSGATTESENGENSDSDGESTSSTSDETTTSSDGSGATSDGSGATSDGSGTSNDSADSDVDSGAPEPEPDGSIAGGTAECEPWDGTRVVAHFEVPGAEGSTNADYFRLPFPNDLRRFSDGSVDLEGFPSATDLTQGFIEAVHATLNGFSAYPTVTLRFSGDVVFEELRDLVFFEDITDAATPRSIPFQYLYSAGGGQYVCPNALSFRPSNGLALSPNHTYAVGVRGGLLDANGLEVAQAPQFAALLAASTPSDAKLAAAHPHYAKLRDYLAAMAEAGTASELLNATVFTTEDPRADLEALAALVAAQDVPSASQWARCSAGAASPCSDVSMDRACGAENELYDEYHALVELPIFQRGDAPYLQSGGEIDFDGPLRTESVCLALAVPKAAAPPGGLPVVLYGHGAGGSFRSGLTSSVAARLAGATNGAGEATPVALLGFDQVAHGPRRGTGLGSTLDPELLLFNILNPASARGTTLQAAADVLSMARFARNLSVPAVGSDAALQFDTSHLAYWGHSQGGSQGAIALPFSADISAAVLSGTGAGILHALLLRTQPPSIPIAVRDAVADPGMNDDLVFGGVYHPALSILQHWVDAVDPLHFARHIARLPLEGQSPKHLFHPYGLGDTYSPPVNLLNFSNAAGLEVAQAHASAVPPDDLGPEAIAFPLVGNLLTGEATITAVVRQYGPPAGDDGHFVAFRAEAANDDVIRFLVQAAYGAVPEVGSVVP
jgi:hypothetical protein